MAANTYGHLLFTFPHAPTIRMRLANRVKPTTTEVITCMMRKKLLTTGRKMSLKLKKIEICMLCGNVLVRVSGIIIKQQSKNIQIKTVFAHFEIHIP